MGTKLAVRTCRGGRRESAFPRSECGGTRVRAVIYKLPRYVDEGDVNMAEGGVEPLRGDSADPGPGGWYGEGAGGFVVPGVLVKGGGRPAEEPGAGPGDDRRSCAPHRVRPRSKYFWRRLFAICLVGLTGAVVWSALNRLVLASAMPRISPGCTVAAARASQAEVALAAANVGNGDVPAGHAGRRIAMASVPAGYCDQIYVVRPGDTLWGIAERYSGSADPRALADELEAEAGGTMLQPGQQLAVP